MNIRAYYQEQGTMSDPGSMRTMVTNIPHDIKKIVQITQNVCIHARWMKAYHLTPTQAQLKEPYLRTFEEKLLNLKEKGLCHVSDPMDMNQKVLGICRDFAVIMTALCREAGFSARERCGFATYFEQGLFTDHWVCEYWDEKLQRWIMVDAQLDQLQAQELKLDFDPLHVPNSRFLNAAQAWLDCRKGKYDKEKFGIFTVWGYEYLICNLILDANALCKMPLHPWDFWEGYKNLPLEKWTQKDFELMDKLAHAILNSDHDFALFYEMVQYNDMIRAPLDLSSIYHGFE